MKNMFPPINFQLAGKILIIVGLAVLTSQVLAYYEVYFEINNLMIFLGLVLLLIGVYVDYAG